MSVVRGVIRDNFHAPPPMTDAGFGELRAGELGVRIAVRDWEIEAAQALRWKVFYEEMGARPTPEMRPGRDVDAYDGFNRDFHDAIYRATHNAFLAEQAMALRGRLAAFRRTQLRHGDRIHRSREEHGQVMAAIARGDGEEAARCMRAHMLNAAGALRGYIAAHAAQEQDQERIAAGRHRPEA